MMTGEKRKFEVSPSVVHKKAVSNDLLSNILRGLVHGIPEDQIIQVIDEHFNPEEVFDARVVLFKNFYSIFANDPNDPTEDRVMGAKEKEIKKRWHIQDILEKIHVIGKLDHDVEFCVPFNYRFVIMTEEEKRYREILDEKSENLDETQHSSKVHSESLKTGDCSESRSVHSAGPEETHGEDNPPD